MQLKDKVAIVTGAGSGLGKAIACRLAHEGARVVVADVNKKKALQAARDIAGLVRADCANIRGIKVDVAKTSEVKALIKRTRASFGRIDILVNNAGVPCRVGYPFTNNTEKDWDRVWDVNVKSIFRTAKAVWPYFTKQKAGRIINIASIAGPINGTMKPPYSVSKMGVISFTRILAKEFAPYGVTVNAVSPGIIWTPFWAKELAPYFPGKSMRDVFDERVQALVPMKREQTPEDIAYAVLFFASDEAKNITGQVLSVDGGVVMW